MHTPHSGKDQNFLAQNPSIELILDSLPWNLLRSFMLLMLNGCNDKYCCCLFNQSHFNLEKTLIINAYHCVNLLLFEGFCMTLGVGRSLHPRRRPHRPVLSDYGSGCWSSYVRRPNLQSCPGHCPQPEVWWQMGRPDSSWNNPGKSHRQHSRCVFERLHLHKLSKQR